MNVSTDSNEKPAVQPVTSIFVLLARLTWCVLGPLVLGLTTITIVTRGSGWATSWNLLFALIVAAMIGGRWVEQRSGSATTLTGEPATPQDWRRYWHLLIPTAAGIWIAANALGNHILA
jgi:hypothetical protein